MTTSKNITPAKFRCLASLQCPSIHETENGDIIIIGQHVSKGELKNMNVLSTLHGEGAIQLTREFVEAFIKQEVAKWIDGK